MLWHRPPHRVSVLRPIAGRDSGGGTTVSYTTVQSAVPCSISSLDSDEIARFAMADVRVTHTVAVAAAYLSVTVMPGDVLVADDTGDRYRIQGLRRGRAYGHIPAMVYATCEQIL